MDSVRQNVWLEARQNLVWTTSAQHHTDEVWIRIEHQGMATALGKNKGEDSSPGLAVSFSEETTLSLLSEYHIWDFPG